MLKKGRSLLLLSALLLPTQFALAVQASNGAAPSLRTASNRHQGQAANPATHGAPKRGKSRNTPYNFTLPRIEHEAASNPMRPGVPSGRSGMLLDESRNETAPGVHLSSVESRPALGYRLDKDEDLKLHVGRSGAGVGLAVSF